MGKEINISEDMIQEVLCKLPLKSVLRFKCISRQWLSLISSKYFIKQHLKISKSSTDDEDNKLFFSFKLNQTFYRFSGFGSCSLGNDPIVMTHHFDNHLTRNPILIVGSCNGLILININKSSKKLLLWNPLTKEVNDNTPPPCFDDKDQVPSVYGFGYDEAQDAYKVVCVELSFKCPYAAHMYSFKTGSWKKIGNFDKGFLDEDHAKFVNGRFHWLAWTTTRFAYRGFFEIVSLDLAEEKYESIGGPKCFSNHNGSNHILKLEELGGFLSLVVTMRYEHDVNVWAMMEYGNAESWTKVWKLSNFFSYRDRVLHRSVMKAKPLCLKKNGDIAVALGTNIIVYNGKNEMCKSPINTLGVCIEQFTVYRESLVSPFGDE
ncbi:hypothetical protein ACP275_08G098900 [Erythranthe tilingii]